MCGGVQKFATFVNMRPSQYESDHRGRMAEWSNAPDSKSGIRSYRIVGSNPTPSATNKSDAVSCSVGFFVFSKEIKASLSQSIAYGRSKSQVYVWVFWWVGKITLTFLVGSYYAKSR